MGFLDELKSVSKSAKQKEEQERLSRQKIEQEKREFEKSVIPDELLKQIAAYAADYFKEKLKEVVSRGDFESPHNHAFLLGLIYDMTHFRYSYKEKIYAKEAGHLFDYSKEPEYWISSENKYFKYYSDGVSQIVYYSTKKHMDQFFQAVVDILKNDGCVASYGFVALENKKEGHIYVEVYIPCDRHGNIIDA